mmetsp:Transcript_66168/g.181391  ORF Transcript_66168/g.181391 Transcript_66168/m.181391 type:complete len:120 (+) Transcript_66168:311-670(+)
MRKTKSWAGPKAREVADTHRAELVVWLGRGKTRWRGLSELESVHHNLLTSLGVYKVIEINSRRFSPVHRSLSVLVHSIHLLGQVYDLLPRGRLSPPLLDWLVNKIGGMCPPRHDAQAGG